MRKLFAILSVSVLGFQSVNAQTPLQQVDVTASILQRKGEINSGGSSTVLKDSLIQANVGKNLTELLGQQAGIVVNGATQSPGSVQTVYFRGASRGQTLILLNGLPVYDASDISQAFDLNTIPLQQIERIEILRGGQSVVYGSDAISGVINIITKKNSDKRADVRAHASVGSFNTSRIGADVSGTINGIGYQIGYDKTISKGFSSAAIPANAPANTVFDKDGFNRDALNIGVKKQLGDKLTASAFFRNTFYNADLDASAFTDDKDYTSTTRTAQLGGGLQYQLDKGFLALNYQRNNTARRFTDDSTDVPVTAFSNYSFATYDSYTDFLDAYGSFQLTERLTLLAGADFQHFAMNQTYLSVSNFGPFESPAIDRATTNMSNISTYASANYAISDFGIELGGRLNNNTNYGNNFSYSVNPYFAKNGFKVFAVLARSFKNPSLYQVYSQYGNLDLQPQTGNTVDVGVQYADKKSSRIAATVFRRNTSDLFFFKSLPQDPFGQYVNLNGQQDSGVEVEVAKQFGKFSFSGNYTHLFDSKTVIDATDAVADNLAFFRIPRNAFNVNATYKITPKLLINSNLQNQSGRSDTFYNAETFKSETVKLDAFTLLNALVSYKITDQFTVSAAAENLLDQRYAEVYGYNSRPRNYRLNVLFSL